MKLEANRKNAAARVVSVIGHPFVLLALTISIVAGHNAPPIKALTIVGATVLLTVAPLLLIIRRKVLRGIWSDHDISDASERRNFYPAAIGVIVFAVTIFQLFGFPRSLIFGMLVSLALLLTAMLINRRSKISLHLIFAAFFAVSLMAVSYWIGGFFLLAAGAVGWSRVVLGRHTLAQVLAGALLGAAGGVLLLKISGRF